MAINPELELLISTFSEITRRYCFWAQICLGDSSQEMLTARKLLAELNLAIAIANAPYVYYCLSPVAQITLPKLY